MDLSEPSLSALLFYTLTHFSHFYKKKTILFSKKCRIFLEIIQLSANTLEKKVYGYHLELNQKERDGITTSY